MEGHAYKYAFYPWNIGQQDVNIPKLHSKYVLESWEDCETGLLLSSQDSTWTWGQFAKQDCGIYNNIKEDISSNYISAHLLFVSMTPQAESLYNLIFPQHLSAGRAVQKCLCLMVGADGNCKERYSSCCLMCANAHCMHQFSLIEFLW